MNTVDTGQYLDLGGLSSLRHDARQTPNDAETLRKVAEQFESLFVHMLLKSQRAANLGDPLFDSNALDTYRDMQDQQMSMELSKQGGFGLADMLVQQLGKYIAPSPEADIDPQTAAPARFPGVVDAGTVTPLVDLDATGPAVLPTSNSAAQVDAGAGFEISEWPVRAAGQPPASVAPSSADTAVLAAAPITPVAHRPLAASSTLAYRVEAATDRSEREPLRWQSPEQFVQDVLPHAKAAAEKIGVDPRLLVAQAALETGWGQHVPQSDETAGYNLFGIKADHRWDGNRVAWNTLEHDGVEFIPTRAQFRAYEGLGDAINDYADFIQGNPRYQDAIAESANPDAYIQALQRAGYATDPNYADKVMRIYHGDRLNAAVANG